MDEKFLTSSTLFSLRSSLWFAACAGLCLVLLYPTLRGLVLGVEVTPAERGYGLALRYVPWVNAGDWQNKPLKLGQ